MLGRFSITAWPCVVSALIVFVLSLVFKRVYESSNIATTIVFGACTAQLSSLAVFVCLSKGEFWRRLLPLLVVIAATGFASLLKDQQETTSQEKAKAMFELVGVATLMVGASQLPLWLIRIFAGWRLSPADNAGERESVWSIRDLLAGTFLCALMLAAPHWRTPPSPKAWDFYWPIVIGSSIFMACSTVICVPPAVWLLLRRPRGARGAAWFLLVVWFVYLGVFSAFAAAYAAWNWEEFGQLLLFVLSYAVSLLLALLSCHALSFRLVTRWDKPVTTKESRPVNA